MKLQTLLENIPIVDSTDYADTLTVTDIACASQKITPGALFVAICGTHADGHSFINQAIENGASAIIVQGSIQGTYDVPIVAVKNTREVYAHLSSRFFSNPSSRVKTIGVTGTNGKTTITFLLAHILRQCAKVGLLSTIQCENGKDVFIATQTTPDSYTIQEQLSAMRNNHCAYCVMEVSSHSLAQQRVCGVHFDAAIFTNLTQDHLDYHETMQRYFNEKRKLFFDYKPDVSIVNVDDPHGVAISQKLRKEKCFTYGIDAHADFKASEIELGMQVTTFSIEYKKKLYRIQSNLICRHNVYNILAAFAYAYLEGYDPAVICAALNSFAGVPGRLEKVPASNNTSVYVDYAHTPDAFYNVFRSISEMSPNRIITVFGCGGDRDTGKRPKMGAVASAYSDVVILTNDNPRNEDESRIVNDIKAGMSSTRAIECLTILDRSQAIEKALEIAHEGDVVLILGKGHEDYMIKNGVKTHFSDQEVVRGYVSEVRDVLN